MSVLHIVTPVSRPHNLPAVYESIRAGFLTTFYAWWCIFDPRAPFTVLPAHWRGVVYWGPGPEREGAVGYPQRNFALDRITTGWIYFLDDDNLIHPGFEGAFHDARQLHPGVDWFIFRQVRPNGSLYLMPHCPPRVGLVDLGQVVIKRDVFGTLRFEEDRYDADGRLFERLAGSVAARCIDREATYYNALR